MSVLPGQHNHSWGRSSLVIICSLVVCELTPNSTESEPSWIISRKSNKLTFPVENQMALRGTPLS